jgi:membrane-bound lytic murein transglycosylase B
MKLIFFILLFFFAIRQPISHNGNSSKKYQKIIFFKSVVDSLLQKGADSESVFQLINNYQTHFNEKYTKVNVFPQNLPQYPFSIKNSSLRAIRKFIEANSTILGIAEQKFGVPREIIASILWVETRLGDILGTNHLPSVFLSMAMASNPEILNKNFYEIKESANASLSLDSLWNIIKRRADDKAAFAINELIALLKMKKEFRVDVFELYGSISGAFGISQFLPSSYIAYGVDGDGDGEINLFNISDAIFSVGNFLKQNGWKNNDSIACFNALFRYNRSKDYVNRVFFVARKISE